MITCNHCGNENPASAVMCQKCGKPFATRTESESGQKNVGREQQGLPAWLESLRASERPVTSNYIPPSIYTGDLADEGSVPSWMRPQQNDAIDNPPSHPYSPLRPASTSAPNTDEGMLAKGISARSLIDEQTLPKWLQKDKQAAGPQSRLDASSLIEQDAMPAWLKAIQPQPAVIQPQVQAVTPPADFSARDLIDQSSLPKWLSGQEAGTSTNPGQMGAPGQGFSASSLLDMNAMPRWLQEISKEHRAKGMMPAGSLIEANSLPTWLREENEQQQMGMQAPQQEGVASLRGENIRVPNRPRNGKGSNEESKVAADVFASMLDVTPTSAPLPTSQPDAQVPQRDAANTVAEQAVPLQGFIEQQPQESHQLLPPFQQQAAQVYEPSPISDYPQPIGQPTQAALQQENNSSLGVPMQATGTQKPAAKPAKRGFFEFFRSWFSR
ncbi:MAG: hypothetical protein JO183_07420 [Ktedonobacteraceae bacterium]|nr:hypothetical protein [Ktedonobacteraceae bacterium]